MAYLSNNHSFRIGKVFQDTFGVIFRNPGIFFGVSAILSGIPSLAQNLALQPQLLTSVGEETLLNAVSPALGISAGITAVILLIAASYVLQSALTQATIDDLGNRPVALGRCLAIATRLLLPAIGMSLLVTLGAGLGFMFFIVPGVLLLIGWSVALPVLVQEQHGVFGSMSRSRVLTKGSRWPLFGLFLILGVFMLIVQSIGEAANTEIGGIAGVLIIAVAATITGTVTSALLAATYVELLSAKEGTSVDDLADVFA